MVQGCLSLNPDSTTYSEILGGQASAHLCLSFLISITGTTIVHTSYLIHAKYLDQRVSAQASSLHSTSHPPLSWNMPVSPSARRRAEGHGTISRSPKKSLNRNYLFIFERRAPRTSLWSDSLHLLIWDFQTCGGMFTSKLTSSEQQGIIQLSIL